MKFKYSAIAMKFKYSAIGRNTKENREHLERLGYIRGFFNIPDRGYIKTINPGTYNLTNIIQPLTEYINCLHSDALFQAVTAMRDDSDVFQLFTDGKDFIECDCEDWLDCIMYRKSFHKATLAELMAHFKVEH